MDERAKYQAEIEAKLAKFGETLHEITTKRKMRESVRPTLDLDATIGKHKAATAKLAALAGADNRGWPTAKTEMETMMDDIDRDLRQAMAYYK